MSLKRAAVLSVAGAAVLVDKAPEGFGAGRAMFLGSGSEAMEAALKLARQYHLERGEHDEVLGLYGAGGPAEPEMQLHVAVRIGKTNLIQQPLRRHGKACLFLTFAHSTILRRFAWLAFAAGEFRKPGERNVLTAHADENLAVMLDDCDADRPGGPFAHCSH